MTKGDRTSGMKSAYEAALERMEARGISRPDETGLDDARREEMAEIRRRAEARLAELEILHRDRLAKLRDPGQRREEEENYRRERRRVEDDRERELENTRSR